MSWYLHVQLKSALGFRAGLKAVRTSMQVTGTYLQIKPVLLLTHAMNFCAIVSSKLLTTLLLVSPAMVII